MNRLDHVIKDGFTWNNEGWRNNVGIKLSDAERAMKALMLFRIEGTNDLQVKILL